MHRGGPFVRSVAQFWIGDLIGVVVTTPLLLVADARGRRPMSTSCGGRRCCRPAAVVAALCLVFGSGLGDELKLFYVLFLPLIWIAMRRGLAGTTAATLLVQIGLIAALLFGGHAPGEVLDFQFLMLALALTGLFLGVTVDERRAAERSCATSNSSSTAACAPPPRASSRPRSRTNSTSPLSASPRTRARHRLLLERRRPGRRTVRNHEQGRRARRIVPAP